MCTAEPRGSVSLQRCLEKCHLTMVLECDEKFSRKPGLPESASLDLLFLISEKKNLQSLTPLRQENVWMMKHALSEVLSSAHVFPLVFPPSS